MRAFRPAVLTVAFAVTCVGGVAAGSAMTPDGPDPRTIGAAAVTARPGSERIGARAGDPGGDPGWAVRTYISETGLKCLEAGRYDGRSFGRQGADRVVIGQPADAAGACAVPGQEPLEPAINRYPASSKAEGRTAVFGRASDEVERVEVTVDGRRSALVIAEDGTFLLVLPGAREPQSLPLVAILRDGEQRPYDWR